MGGYWINCEDGVQRTEIWTGPWAYNLEGIALAAGPGRSLERMRIWYVQGDGQYLRITSEGGEARDYELIEGRGMHTVYSARQPGFPQLIQYTRTDDSLLVAHTGEGGEPTVQRVFHLAEFNSRCPGMGSADWW